MDQDRVPRTISTVEGESWASVIRHMPLGLFRARVSGVLVDASPGLLTIIGCQSLLAAQAISLFDLLEDDEQRQQWQHRLRRAGVLEEPSARLRRMSGELIWVRARIKAAGPAMVEGYLEDVTAQVESDMVHRRRMEQQLQSAQRMEAVGSLAGGVAHDFNNVLAVIGMASELMLDEIPEGDPLQDRVSEISDATERAKSLTHQLLVFSRRQIMWPKSIDLNTTVRDVGRLLRRLIGEDIVFELDLDPDLPPVKADSAQLEQVIMNLVVNAKDAMPDGGWLRIETNCLAEDSVMRMRYPLLGSGAFIHLVVSDTGIGIDEMTLPRIFEPFFTTKEGGTGTGLGLSTAYGIVKQSGGFLFGESQQGRGATFRVFLPQAQDPISEAIPRPTVEPPTLGVGSILVVEDEAALRRMIARSLSARGYRVLEAADGFEALEVIECLDDDLDLVLCDVVMPRMGADALAAGLRAAGRDIPFLSMSGYRDSPEDALASNRGGPQLEKPFSIAALLQMVQRALEEGVKTKA